MSESEKGASLKARPILFSAPMVRAFSKVRRRKRAGALIQESMGAILFICLIGMRIIGSISLEIEVIRVAGDGQI